MPAEKGEHAPFGVRPGPPGEDVPLALIGRQFVRNAARPEQAVQPPGVGDRHHAVGGAVQDQDRRQRPRAEDGRRHPAGPGHDGADPLIAEPCGERQPAAERHPDHGHGRHIRAGPLRDPCHSVPHGLDPRFGVPPDRRSSGRPLARAVQVMRQEHARACREAPGEVPVGSGPVRAVQQEDRARSALL